MDLTYERSARLNGLISNYKNIDAYMKPTARMNYVQFDYAVSHDLVLFSMNPDIDFADLERRIDAVLAVMPAVKRIFAQPLIHLKEHDVVLPVDAVRTINSNTINHIASHSELWADLNRDGIKPEKLLTKTYEDNYGIYENLVFCNVVDDVLAFTRANLRRLKEMRYANRTVEINLLERVNHLNYFLALGKLHIGYSRSFESCYAVSERCMNKLRYIAGAIAPRLKNHVYKDNANRPANIKLRKTNILSMHKEYHRIYKFAKAFGGSAAGETEPLTDKTYARLVKSYEFFCGALCIFAVGHFNFECDEKKTFDLSRPDMDFKYKSWTIKIGTLAVGNRRAISLEVEKDKPYTVVLIPTLDDDCDEVRREAAAAVEADEYIVCSPFDGDERGAVFVDVSSIESFRRLQQIILRAMIYADAAHDDCPFCRDRLIAHDDTAASGDAVYECASCRTKIIKAKCEATGKPYFYTGITDFTPKIDVENDPWLARRDAEGIMYYRNITPVDAELHPVCPHCGRVHNRES